MLMPDEGGGGGGGGGGGAPGGGAPGGAPSGGSVESSVGRAGNVGSSATQADVSGGEEDWGGFESLDAIELGDDGGAATQPPIEPRRDAPPAPPVVARETPPATRQPPAQSQLPTRPEDVTLANVEAAMSQQRDGLITHWANNFFQMSQEEVDALATNPETVLPQLLAKGLYYALSSIPAQIKHFVPNLVNSTVENTAKYERSANEFYDSWPGLRGHETATVRAIQMLVAQNPQITRADAIRMSGNIVCQMLGVDPNSVAGQRARGGGGRRAPGQVVSNGAYVPAGASSAGTGNLNGQRPPAQGGDWFDGFDLPNSDPF